MTRRHDERWALPIGNDEYIHHLEEEFFRLRQVERTLDEQVAFLRNERDRLKEGSDELVRELNDARLTIERLRLTLSRIADPEEFDANWKAMRKAARNALAS